MDMNDSIQTISIYMKNKRNENINPILPIVFINNYYTLMIIVSKQIEHLMFDVIMSLEFD